MKKFIFRFLDELLYAFTGDDIACRTVSVKCIARTNLQGHRQNDGREV